VELTVQYFAGCPHVDLLSQRLTEAGCDPAAVRFEPIESAEEADRVGFRGSPTILVSGDDPFVDGVTPVGYACRFYATEAGREGAPSADQLARALRP
jgi:hypothetical protein